MKVRDNSDAWICPAPEMLPDFIIAGAMKAGTSTIHQLLQMHPDISIPEEEVHFFDLDDPIEHADFGNPRRGVSPALEFAGDSGRFWEWYGKTLHEPAKTGQLIGEDSTTYLSSRLAISRIARQEKAIKLIICLRQPTLRAYSNYWHLHKTRRISCSFERLLEIAPGLVLQRSCYGQQIRDLLSMIDRDKVYFVVLEELKHNYDRIIQELCEFIGVDFEKMPEIKDQVYSNQGIYPRSLFIQNTINAFFPASQLSYYEGFMPFTASELNLMNKLKDLTGRGLSKCNRSRQKMAPPMNESTKNHLDRYFESESYGLSAIFNIDLASCWFS